MGAAQEVKAQQAEARMEGTRPNEAFAPKIRALDDGKRPRMSMLSRIWNIPIAMFS